MATDDLSEYRLCFDGADERPPAVMSNLVADLAREQARRFACAVEMAYVQGCAVCGAPPTQLRKVGGAGMQTHGAAESFSVEMIERFLLTCDRCSIRLDPNSTQANSGATHVD